MNFYLVCVLFLVFVLILIVFFYDIKISEVLLSTIIFSEMEIPSYCLL